MNQKKDSRGNVRYLWVLVGAYLLYLAYQQAQYLYRWVMGERGIETGNPIVSGVSGAIFAAVGVWVIWREWAAWKYAEAHKDDPETWSDDAQASENPPQLPDETSESDEESEGAEESEENEESDKDDERSGETS